MHLLFFSTYIEWEKFPTLKLVKNEKTLPLNIAILVQRPKMSLDESFGLFWFKDSEETKISLEMAVMMVECLKEILNAQK